TPVLVGEWGGFGSYADVARHCTFLLETFDRYGWSFTYWEWLGKKSLKSAATKLLMRVYPKAVAGDLLSFKTDQSQDAFCMEWSGDNSISAPTIVCLPHGLQGKQVKTEPVCSYTVESNESTIQHVVIMSKQGGLHTLRIE
ncbi:MAG: hypothetical protein PHQ40_19220, partial [Anaerolineaceae bacterium]|nr:hypothetical protein [Anaerolineaceae bacterium]